MEAIEVDEIPVDEEPVQITDQIFVQDKGTRVLEPEMKEPTQQEAARSEFDLSKLSYELQQGYRIYSELLADSNRNVTWPFVQPVDADSLGLWDYYERIKRPMCFSTIGSKFLNNKYTSITEVIADVRLILENCYRYNGPNHWVSKLGQKLEKILEQKLALLNRSLRDKVTLAATMTINNGIPMNDLEVSGRRRSSRQNYLSMVNGENSSSLVNHLKIIEESEEKERRRQREKEKKEANQALLQDLEEWEEKELTATVMKQLHSMWEIPSIGSLLYMVKDLLGIEDINLTEFEMSFVYPNKSSLLARIFTGLLITPHQRKSIYKRPSMKFKMWESKLKEKLDAWYKTYEKEGPYGVALHYGIDLKFFDILGNERNPLEGKSYLDLTLHQRVWVLKALCDVCFHKEYDIREKVNLCDFMEQRELFLGCDAENHSFIYFPIFQTTDLRVYRHDPLEVPSLKSSPIKEPSPPPPPEKKSKRSTFTPTRTPKSARLRQLRSCTVEEEKQEEFKDEDKQADLELEPSTEVEKTTQGEDKPPSPAPPSSPPPPPPVFQCEDGFYMACHDIESLKSLAEQFAEPPPPPVKRGRRSSKPPPPRKRCVVDLHETLLALLQELDKYEIAFSKNCTKAKIKIMKESLEPEPVDEPEEESEPECPEEWESELSDIDAGAKLDAQDDDYRIEDEYGNTEQVQKKGETEQNNSDSDESSGTEGHTSINKRKRKLSKGEDTIANAGHCISIAIQTQPPNIKKKPKKWSPTKEKVLPLTSAGPSPAVVISPVTAQESLKAASKSSDTGSKTSPEKILLNVLGQAIKRAQEHASSLQPADKKDISGTCTNVDGSTQALGSASSPPKANAATSTTPTKSQRKRILVSPEGKAHEIKPSFHIVNTQASPTIPTTSLPSHPPVQRKSDMLTVVSKNKAAVMAIIGPHGIQTTPTSTPKTLPVSTQERPRTIHQKPNILSRNKKQPASCTKAGVLPINTSLGNNTATSNHNYALPTNLVSKVVMAQNNSTPTSMNTSTASGVKVVQFVPNAAQSTNVSTVNTLQGVPVKGRMSNPNMSPVIKTVSHAGLKTAPQPGLKTIVQSGQNKDVTSTVVQPTPLSTASIKTPSNAKNIVSKTTATLRVKPQSNQAVTSQTKIIFIPASSVDAKSPLANFKPQTLMTTSGQSIYGYAVVVPPGSSQEVNAVINSSLKKTSQVTVSTKQVVNSTQGKLSTVSQGKPLTTTMHGTPLTIGLQGKSTGIQGKPVSSQAKGATVVLQGSTSKVEFQDKSKLLQGKPPSTGLPWNSTTVLQGKPVASSLQGKSTATSLQQQLSNTCTVLQGKPTTMNLQEKPTNTISKIVIGNALASQIPGTCTPAKGIAVVPTPATQLHVNPDKTSIIGSSGLPKALGNIGTPSTTSHPSTTTSILQVSQSSSSSGTNQICTGSTTSTTSNMASSSQQHKLAANLASTTQSSDSAMTSLPSSTQTLLVTANTAVQPDSRTLTLLQLARSNITNSSDQSLSLVAPTLPSVVTCHPITLQVASKVTTSTLSSLGMSTNHASTTKPQSCIVTVASSDVSETTRSHFGVPSSSTSIRSGISHTGVISATLPQCCVMTPTTSGSTITTQPQAGAMTIGPHSNVLDTVSMASQQPHGVAIETNINNMDPILLSKAVASDKSAVQLQDDIVKPDKDNVLLPNKTSIQEKKDENETLNCQDEVHTLSENEPENKSRVSENQKLTFYNGVSVHSILDNHAPSNCIKTATKDTCEVLPMETPLTKNLSDAAVKSKDLCDVRTTNGVHCSQESDKSPLQRTDTS